MPLHTEGPTVGNVYRARLFDQIRSLIASEQKAADANRAAFFSPDRSSPEAYVRSLGPYRHALRAMLGWPLTIVPVDRPSTKQEFVAEEDFGRLYRIWIGALPDLETYGLLLLPKAEARFPLVICLHGGDGTPELYANLFQPSIYNDMARRLLRRGCAVFAPQLPMWTEEFGPAIDRVHLDNQLKQIGGSLAALNAFQISRSLDALADLESIDESRIGLMGLSWGGFHSVVTAALDTRIKAVLSSCFFNNRYRYDLAIAMWRGSAQSFLDAEIAGMVCPRPLCIEVGRHDDEFAVESARPEVDKVRSVYDALGINARFKYREHDGGHEFDREDDSIDFLTNWLRS